MWKHIEYHHVKFPEYHMCGYPRLRAWIRGPVRYLKLVYELVSASQRDPMVFISSQIQAWPPSRLSPLSAL